MKLSTLSGVTRSAAFAAMVALGLGLGLGACSAANGDNPVRKRSAPKKMDPACKDCVWRPGAEDDADKSENGGCFKGAESEETCEERCCIK